MNQCPADTRRNNNVIMTSKTTSFWRHYDVIIAPCARWLTARLSVSPDSDGSYQTHTSHTCPICKNIDDEYHFLLECCLLKYQRIQCIPAYYWKRPSMFKCIQHLNSSNKTLNRLPKYVHRGSMLKIWIAVLSRFLVIMISCMLYYMYSVLLYRL